MHCGAEVTDSSTNKQHLSVCLYIVSVVGQARVRESYMRVKEAYYMSKRDLLVFT